MESSIIVLASRQLIEYILRVRGEIRGQSLEISIPDALDKNLICGDCCCLPSECKVCLQLTNILIECRKNNIVAENFCMTIVKTDLKRILNSLEVKINSEIRTSDFNNVKF